MIEKEFKYRLTKEEYLDLKKYFLANEALSVSNTNYYFERENNFSIRLRKSDKLELTIKEKKSNNTHLENNFLLDESTFNEILKKGLIVVKDLLSPLGLKNFNKLTDGKLVTKRLNLEELGFIISLDESHYFDVIDYEIELEQVDASLDLSENLKILTNKFNLKVEETISKQARFYKRKGEL